MKRTRPLSVAVAIAVAGLAATSARAEYTYDVGPNYVNMSGSRCRALDSSSAQHLKHEARSTSVKSGVGTVSVICPVTRRSTQFYQDGDDSSLDTTLDLDYLLVGAKDGSGTASVSCRPFARDVTSGAVHFGPTAYLCSSSPWGCSSAPTASWQGTTTMIFMSPLPELDAANWGVLCSLPSGSAVHYYESAVNPIDAPES